MSTLSETVEKQLQHLQSNSAFKNVDRSVLLAILASRRACSFETFQQKEIGINIGSSRGATGLFETYHKEFIQNKKVSAYTSPTTTLGNISSWVGQDLGAEGIQIDQSVTCSTAMHALLNGIAWLQADMANVFLVGGTEAALTPFTVAQLQALKLYSRKQDSFACESLNFQKKRNSMVLGEAASVAVLEKEITENTLAVIKGYGFASEKIEHGSSISNNAECFQKSMKKALDNADLKTVDAIIMHAPGSIKGDMAEKNAIDAVFTDKSPLLTSNKWMVGHTFAASGMLSIEMGIYMLQHNKFIENPFYKNKEFSEKELKTVLINAVGFGGNAVSIIISKP